MYPHVDCDKRTNWQLLLLINTGSMVILITRTLSQHTFLHTSPHTIPRPPHPPTQELYRELIYDGINVDVMHAERSPAQREEVIRRFRTGEIWVLICTDLMARGIDFKGVQMVINYDLPQTAVAYIHRIGKRGNVDVHNYRTISVLSRHNLKTNLTHFCDGH